jgi:FkbM family methyltransferase
MKKLIPHREWLYWARSRFGAWFAFTTYWRVLLGLMVSVPIPVHGTTPMRVPVQQHNSGSVRLRPGTADLHIYDDVFREGEYDVNVGTPKFIVDAGAHIGLTSVFFAKRYPAAKIVAIELDPRNYAVLCENVKPYPNVTPVHAGLWTHETSLSVSNPREDTWGFRAKEGGEIRAVTIKGLMNANGVDRIDLLKIDIEGAEKGVLEDAQDWIGAVGSIVIELHDRFVPGCTEALETAIAGQAFERSMSRGTVVLIRPGELANSS